VIYTGTHDNNTTVGWFQDNANDYEKARLYQYLGAPSGQGVAWDLIRLAYSSVANQAIVPLQDVLGLGSDARMNTPSVAEGNWSWRYRQEALTGEYSDRSKPFCRDVTPNVSFSPVNLGENFLAIFAGCDRDFLDY
jgi:4-alpha-glucanotransferase